MAAASALKLRIEGMDCGSCAQKIETAMRRLPGVAEVEVSVSAASMSITVDEDRTSRAAIRAKIDALGFKAHDPAAAGADLSHGHDHGHEEGPWHASSKGRLVLATGALLAAAWAVSLAEPGWAAWPYVAAAALGLVPIVRRAVVGALNGTPFSIETLMSVAAIGAIAIGEAPEAAVVVFLFAVGELLEGVAASRARAGVKALADLIPRTARRVRGDAVETVAASELEVGDLVLVRPGDRIPSDGSVVSGTSEVNEAPITGESRPVPKEAGASVYAGSINANGELHVAITRTAADNTIARIVHMVEEAQSSKAPTARFIERFSRWYTPAAMALALAVVVGPPLLVGADWQTWIYRGLAVLLIACPCALVISTPAAVASGLASGARRGLLIKGGAALETLGRIRTVAFDKTGTLTEGRPRVVDVAEIGAPAEAVLAKAAAVERSSSHPLGAAIIEAAEARGLEIPRAFGGIATPGKAVTARISSGFVSVGSPRHAAEQGILTAEAAERVASLESEGNTVVAVSEGKRLLGLVALMDRPRADAVAGLARLRSLGLRAVMLTGDNARAAATIAGELGIEHRAELLPAAKLDAIAAYRADGPVAMVGDGVNDAPALAAASVGVAMGGGADVALETADAALLKDRVGGVAELVVLSRATLANIWTNVALALGLKGAFLVATLAGATPLWMAILADTGATVLVTANALRLLRFNPSDASR
ncbi:heavy metal translocating P-type ATPase [Hansschlegelia beijingensis]|uniref:P-type Zn(2+) transporter n=1 Tax=Hansschlegelia beijingensis TaxID=1133344 RepID=A0A7W6GED8_9HYPH|nr:heavy metal translocating P-type ATPase [Hansschlegelia beijingensis]MBB3971792.1 Cd2+/Zn2+-exporting ATPase [Hansschlegelia beijingensis]